MFKGKKIVATVMTTLIAASLLLSGCSKKAEPVKEATPNPTKQEEKLPKVELVYYFVGSPQKGLQAVEDNLNKIIEPKINATVKLKLIDWGEYDQKMGLAISSGADWDLAFTSAWTNNYFQNVAKGSFADLTELIDKYSPDLKKVVPQTFFKAATVKGKIYGVPNFQQATPGYGYIIKKDVADKLKIDWKAPKKFSDLTPILDQIKKANLGIVTYGYSQQDDVFVNATPMFGFEALGDSKTPGWISLSDSNMKVVNQYETQEFKDYLAVTRDWYKKGYVKTGAGAAKDMQSDIKSGKIAVKWGQIDLDTEDYVKAGLEFPGRLKSDGNPSGSYDFKFVTPILTTDKAAATMTAINVNSKNKERAMMFINLLNTDKEVYNAISYGVEGVNYTKVGENRIQTKANGGYQAFTNWEFGNMANQWYDESQPKGAEVNDIGNKLWIDFNKNAKGSPALGFTFDFTPVKTEKAQVDSVIAELYFSVASGSVDTAKFYPQFIEKLKKAGADKIIAEKQKQLDQWKADNKK